MSHDFTYSTPRPKRLFLLASRGEAFAKQQFAVVWEQRHPDAVDAVLWAAAKGCREAMHGAGELAEEGNARACEILFGQAASGSGLAWEIIVGRTREIALEVAKARGIARNHSLVDEMVQGTSEKLLRMLRDDTFDMAKAVGWQGLIRRIATRHLRTIWRKEHLERKKIEEFRRCVRASVSCAEQVYRTQEVGHDRFRRGFDSATAPEQHVLMLWRNELSFEEIAERAKVSKSMARRIIQHFYSLLKPT